METKDIPQQAPSNWQPITDKADLACLGKLGEEVCECGARIFRCIIQGVFEEDPDSGRLNIEMLEDEIADVEALIAHVKTRFGVNEAKIRERRKAKYDYKAKWFVALDAQVAPKKA